jgi:hypothetical protein
MQMTADASGNVMALIHYAFLRPGGTRHELACSPLYSPGKAQHTDDPRAVTCPACKGSEPYLRASGD